MEGLVQSGLCGKQVGKMMCSVVKCFCWVVCVCTPSHSRCAVFVVVVIVRLQNHLEKEDCSLKRGKRQIIWMRSCHMRVLFVYFLSLYY